MSNAINPEHYNRLNPQPKDVIRAWGLNFNLGSAVKYISRAGHKDDIVQDLKKAQEFIQFEIDAIEGARRKEQFRVGDTVDVNYVAPFDPRGVGFNGERGGTGKIVDIKDEYIYVDESTLFHSCVSTIPISSIVLISIADPEHIEDKRRA